jgi:hypothetical protein
MSPRPPRDGEDEPEWWGAAGREKRNTPLVILGIVLLASGGFGAWLMFGRSPPVAQATAPDASAPSAVEDPATLVPITLRPATKAADDIFTSRILRFTIALDQAAKRGATDGGEEALELTRAEDALRDDDVRGALGPRASTALQEVVAAAKVAAHAAPEDEASATAFEIATARLDNALIASGMPYFIDASVIVDPARAKRLVLLYEFSIVSTDLHASGAARVRAVHLRRLDRLNWTHTLLGFVNPHRVYAVVLLDQIDEQLVTNVLPALANDAAMPLMASEAVGDPSQAQGGPAPAPRESLAIAMRAGKNVRAEIDELLGLDHAAGRELGEAIRARRALFDKWNERLKARGSLKSPSKLYVDVDALELEVGAAIPRAEIEELRRIQKRFARPDVLRAYTMVRDAFVASVERHEVEHRLDQITPIPTPKALDAVIPPGGGRAGENARDHVRNELSAYLSQVARDEPLTKTTFTMLLRFLADPRVRGGAESYAALIATEELAGELGIQGVAPLLHDRQLDDARIDVAHRELTAVPAPKLRAAARKVWARLFGRELPELHDLLDGTPRPAPSPSTP